MSHPVPCSYVLLSHLKPRLHSNTGYTGLYESSVSGNPLTTFVNARTGVPTVEQRVPGIFYMSIVTKKAHAPPGVTR